MSKYNTRAAIDSGPQNNPSIGILTGKLNTNYYPKGKKARLFKEMITYGRERGLFIFYFYPEDVNWENKIFKGFTCNKEGRWITGCYPLPDIVYNRIVYRTIETREEVAILLKRCEKEKHIFLFNSRFLDKWEVYQAIARHTAELQLTPETALFSEKNLKNFLSRHFEIYLKPRNGSRGKGIIKVKHRGNHGFSYTRTGSSSGKWVACSTFNDLYKKIKNKIPPQNPYIIQKAINLATYNGKIFDLRTLVQKDGTGYWTISGVAVRIAAENRIVTHIPNGGRAAPYGRVIKHVFNSEEKTKNINMQLENICTLVPVLLEKKLGLNLAVLSMDIGIDAAGKLWIIEVNSKPASFDENDIRQRHLQLLMDYFSFVAQKSKIKD